MAKGILRRPWVWLAFVAIVFIVGFLWVQFPDWHHDNGILDSLQSRTAEYEGSPAFVDSVETAGGSLAPAANTYPVSSSAVPDVSSRQVIQTASLEIRVNSSAAAADELGRMAVAAGGFVQSSSVASDTGGGRHSASLVLRVPSDGFQSFLNSAGPLGEILRKDISGQDVTEEYVDLQARLRNWQNEEEQLRQIQAQAKTVGELLSVRDSLGRVRETIEQLQGRIKYLDNNVSLSTIRVSLYEGAGPAVSSAFMDELRRLGRALYGSVRGLLTFILVLLPWALAGLGVWAAGRRVFRDKK